jgi:membrane-associated HD superfamily phosphohydrolase
MSLLIIVSHVKDGVEMAKEYRLPLSIRPFIAEHHGTTIVEYFYHAANKLRKPGDPEVAEAQFRYPGPKPQSRETAIVMLCDGVEGAVRAMAEPTPGRIESVVSEIVQKRLLDGQLDDCDLTFRELATVEKSLVRSLSGLYHARITYPESEKREVDKRDVERREITTELDEGTYSGSVRSRAKQKVER